MGFVQLRTVCVALVLLTAPAYARDEAFSTIADFALVEDYESGAILFEKNADEPMAPASTTKLLTAEIVFHELKEGRLHLDDMFEVSENAWRDGGGACPRLGDVPRRPQPGAGRGPVARTDHSVGQRRGDHAGRGNRRHRRQFRRD